MPEYMLEKCIISHLKVAGKVKCADSCKMAVYENNVGHYQHWVSAIDNTQCDVKLSVIVFKCIFTSKKSSDLFKQCV